MELHTQLRSTRVGQALRALQAGQFVLVYDADGREEETDMVVASEFVTPDTIGTLRREAGGLICTTLHPRVHRAIGLPFMADVLARAADPGSLLARLTDAHIPYEKGRARSAFALNLNHRTTFTGVTDRDRSTTIQALADVAARTGTVDDGALSDSFARDFRTPGHVHVLNAHEQMLHARRGHTELATALVDLAGLAPSATICEMMGGPDGRALPKSDALKYAAQNGLVFLEGREVLEAWLQATADPAA